MKRITQFILCLVLAVSGYGQGVGGNSVPRTVSGISAALDLISSTQGTIFYRGASGWEALPPGTSGQLFSTQGAAANPIWVTATGGAGDVNGPTLGTATDNAIVRFDGTGGKTVQNSAVTIADTTGAMTWATGQAATLTGGDNGASLALGSGASGSALVTPGGVAGFLRVSKSMPSTSQFTSTGSLQLINTDTTNGNWNSIDFVDSIGGAGAAGIYAKHTDHANDYAELHLVTRGAGGLASRGIFTSAGNLLIGTTTDMASTTGGLTVAATGSGATATAVNTGGLQSANFGLSTVSGGASYFGGAVNTTNGNLTLTRTGADATLTINGGAASYAIANFNPNASTTNNFAILAETGGVVYFQQNNGAATKMKFDPGVNGGVTFATGTGGITSTGTGTSTFAGAVTGNSTFSSGVLSTTAGGYKLFDANGYFVNFRPTGARTYVIEGDASGNDYLTSFTNAGAGKHNLAASGTLSITGAATFAGEVTTSSATLSGAGAIPITKSLVKFTSTGAANALTLANGVDGQRLTIVHDVKGTLGTGVLTPTTKTGFSTVTFTNAGDTVDLVYVTTRGWMVTGSYLATIAP